MISRNRSTRSMLVAALAAGRRALAIAAGLAAGIGTVIGPTLGPLIHARALAQGEPTGPPASGPRSRARTPEGVFGGEELGRQPWVRPRRAASTRTKRRVRDLAERHEQALGAVPKHFSSGAIPDLPGDGDAPARMDSGDDDPDRLLAPSRALKSR